MSDHFSSSDEDLEEIVNLLHLPKAIDYFEQTIPQFTDDQYIHHFRLSRQVTEQLAERFNHSEYYNYQEGDSNKVTPLKFLTVFLWFAANESVSYRDVSDRFNISKSTLFKIIRRVTNFLSNLSPEIIFWPSEDEILEIEAFYRHKNFPGIIGVIDGTHIRIDKPHQDPDSYLNWKQFYSIQAQIVCDNKKKIRDIFIGYPGSVHDARVFRSSPLFETLENKCGNFFIIGDSAYPCLKKLLTPFRDYGQLSRRQQNYNNLLSKNRYIVEHCFGLLKQRFRQLYKLKLRDIREIVHFIRACAVLHNICIDNNFIVEESDNAVQQHIHPFEEREERLLDDRDGIQKRIDVMNALPFAL